MGNGTAASDQDFGRGALDNAKLNRYFGPAVLDRTHQLSFSGYADLAGLAVEHPIAFLEPALDFVARTQYKHRNGAETVQHSAPLRTTSLQHLSLGNRYSAHPERAVGSECENPCCQYGVPNFGPQGDP
jgi:hypothetical protein